MNNFLPGIFHDLLIRVGHMVSELSTRQHHPDIRDSFVPETTKVLQRLHENIERDINSGDLAVEQLHNYYLRKYNTHYSEFQLIEAYKYQVILNYTEIDSYLNRKVSLIYNQIRCVQALPVITTITNAEQYYWAHPLYNLIAVPLGEEKSLLNLPDLFHEIGHLIFKQYKEDLTAESLVKLTEYYEGQKRLVLEEDRSPDLIKEFSHLLRKWRENWVEEFTCDMIGTYLTGAAYGWTNLKISTIGSGKNETYMASYYHPSDEARMRGIFYILNKLGLTADLAELDNSWRQFLRFINCPRHENYDYHFPQELVKALADNVYHGCMVVGLASYNDQQKATQRPISLILNEAWERILANSNDYEAWENTTIEEIRTMVNCN